MATTKKDIVAKKTGVIAKLKKMVKELIKDPFFRKMKRQGLALTFSDVRLKTRYSAIRPEDANIQSWFSRHVKLNIPLVSAAMDTVTESKMGIEISEEGGIGIIHRGMSPERQAKEVARVKFELHQLIKTPRFVQATDTIADVEKIIIEMEDRFHNFPVLDKDRKPIGVLTSNSIKFSESSDVKVAEVMETEFATAKPGTTISQAYDIMRKKKTETLLLVKKGQLAGMYVFTDVERVIKKKSPLHNLDKNGNLVVGAAVGVGKEGLERVRLLVEKNVDVVVIDAAHGDHKNVITTLKAIKKEFPNLDVVAGNISEPKSAIRLARAGADGIKIGQGPGSICTTRIIAGVGCPQLTAVYECAKALRGTGIPCCADGGIVHPGDISNAIGAGASSVMIGNLFSGTDESPGKIINDPEMGPVKIYRGMGSEDAMKELACSPERYNQKPDGSGKVVPEGIESKTPYKGKVANEIFQLVGGLRNGMGYLGAKDISALQKRADFHLMTDGGKKESHPHNIVMAKRAPNYQQ